MSSKLFFLLLDIWLKKFLISYDAWFAEWTRNRLSSSSHSVHPTIFEFTDLESYDEAFQTSIVRETAHINPLTGKVEGVGGIIALKSFFPKKQIISFRAPGYCWTPPHLEALKTLGITYDFSTRFSNEPINFKGITFYPFTVLSSWQGGIREQSYLQRQIIKHKKLRFDNSSELYDNQFSWDSYTIRHLANRKVIPLILNNFRLDLLLK